ncbi:(2Fe-2S) ferredoxin domain-containing protein [Laceyella putida]|uniref:Ferredoxin n=1 Tax=Laceyella putida TaxID=110101 RepID=A0ABW2RLG5_9BACL
MKIKQGLNLILIQYPDLKGGCEMVDLSKVQSHLILCQGASCTKNGAMELTQSIRRAIQGEKLVPFIHTTISKCNGQCQNGPIVIQYPQGNWYGRLQSESASSLVQSVKEKKVWTEKLIYSFDENNESN